MITIITEPQVITPGFNEISYTVKSSEQTRADFKYNVVIKNAAGVTVATKKLVGGTTVNDVTKIDVSGVISRLQDLGFYRSKVNGSEYIYSYATFKQSFTVVISEYYSAALHGDVTKTVLTFPAALHPAKFAVYNWDAKIKPAGIWLTNFDKIKLRATDKAVATFFMGNTAPANITFTFKNAAGTVLQAITKTNPVATANNFFHVHAGLADLKTYTGITTGTYNDTVTYEIKPLGSPSLVFNVLGASCRFPGIKLNYLNDWGAVDTFIFSLAHKRSSKIDRKKAQLNRQFGGLSVPGFSRVNVPYLIEVADSLSLTSGFISDIDSKALLELYSSPLITAEVPAKVFDVTAPDTGITTLPCEIDDTNYEIKQSSVDKLYNITLGIRISTENTRQTL